MTRSLPKHLAYLRPSTLDQWTGTRKNAWAAAAADHGIDGVVTKLDKIDDDLHAAASRHGIDVIGSFAAYSDHAGPAAATPVRPVGSDGVELEPVEWYRGIVPGDPTFDDALIAKFVRELAPARTQTVFLDFLRWPGHWETESRRGGAPREASFDRGTLARFARWLGVETIAPSDVAAHANAWENFRVNIINQTASRLAAVAYDQGIRVGAFVVPLPSPVRRSQYGQDVMDLAEHFDLFTVMTYQQIAELDTAQTLHLTDEVAQQTGGDVVAMLQTSTDPSVTGGWDWGAPLEQDTMLARARHLEDARHAGKIAAICCFPGDARLPDFTLDPHPEGTVR
jgi:hypothetical protein